MRSPGSCWTLACRSHAQTRSAAVDQAECRRSDETGGAARRRACIDSTGASPDRRSRGVGESSRPAAQALQATSHTFWRRPRFLIQTPRPTIFKRGTGKLSLSIVANPDYGVPYGGLPRLLLRGCVQKPFAQVVPDLSLGVPRRHSCKASICTMMAGTSRECMTRACGWCIR